ncbi:response regulator [Rhizobium halophytocola]|uniref:Two-component system response regulator n=1 Tax=Rhizobium halophytocola TaxID=735519 RepID=A0ABS4E6L4_9HYPH|nr:response regulator [Rhizobium halophytocola]MBP1853549.1 two-component system response regulator [Rhizobium halophytocola]
MTTDQRALTILMVDDNQDEVFLTRRLLRRDGIVNNFVSERDPTRIFDTLDHLIELGGDRNRIMILLDLNMPQIDGFSVLRKIRKSKRYKDVTVIMLSASDDEGDMLDSFDKGANGYMVKPFRADEFFTVLNNVSHVRYQLVQ